MITVGSSSSTAPAADAVPEEAKRRVPLITIPITLAVGLLVAAGYVGSRILAAKPQATAVAVASNPAGSTPETPTVSPPVVSLQTGAAQPAQETTVATPAEPAPPAAIPARKEAPRIASSRVEAKSDSDQVPAQGDNVDLIAPQPGQRYLQIAAISSRMVPKFLSDLSRYNVQASMAPGPREGVVRVVIGPFSDREVLARAKAQIQIKWPDCFVRLY